MSNDPDMTPVRPYDGAPDQLGVVRREAAAPQGYPDAPEIRPANPAQWGAVVPLAHPLMVDGKLLDRISIRRLTGEDVVTLIMEDGDDATLPQRARARAAGVHPAVLEALSADDAEEVSTRLRPFLPSSLLAADGTDWDTDPDQAPVPAVL
ncbi:phage tail assembly protein [Camelimonas lactis]|uniref:Tail assembly chaperone E/41/14-like protein n=1 Tax=Camelimonas lactis TaxID=659006 RepID=A0A4V2RX89_9HYPH|nr:phage tail assembly protein [Camelimonas lactis]TCO12450.1 tail assembly chaperone E/41/14-like protein [Camelimonas lactis]